MKRQKVPTEKAVNAKVVFRGVVVEIKKVSDQEVELTFPDNIDSKELLGYLESFGILKRKAVIPHVELRSEVKDEESVPTQREENNVENSEEEVKKEDPKEEKKTDTEESLQAEDATTTKRKKRRS